MFKFLYCQLFDYVRYEVRCWWLIHLICKEGLGLLQLEMETVFRAVVLLIMQKKGLSTNEICIHDSRKLVSQSCRTKGGFSEVYYTVWSIMWFLNYISLVVKHKSQFIYYAIKTCFISAAFWTYLWLSCYLLTCLLTYLLTHSLTHSLHEEESLRS